MDEHNRQPGDVQGDGLGARGVPVRTDDLPSAGKPVGVTGNDNTPVFDLASYGKAPDDRDLKGQRVHGAGRARPVKDKEVEEVALHHARSRRLPKGLAPALLRGFKAPSPCAPIEPEPEA